MGIKRAQPRDTDALNIRDFLHRAGARQGVRGEDLVAEAVQWGVLKDDYIAAGRPEDPTVAEYAEHFRRAADQAQADFDEFVRAVGVEPLVFWEIEEEALANGPRPTSDDLLEGIFVVEVSLEPGKRCLGPDPMSVGSTVEGVYRGPATPYRTAPMGENEPETIPRGRFEVDGREIVVALASLEPLPSE